MGLPNAIVDRLTPGKSAVALIDACNGKNPVTTLKMTTDLKTVKTNIDAHEHCLLDVTDGPKAHDAVNMAVRILLGAGGTEVSACGVASIIAVWQPHYLHGLCTILVFRSPSLKKIADQTAPQNHCALLDGSRGRCGVV